MLKHTNLRFQLLLFYALVNTLPTKQKWNLNITFNCNNFFSTIVVLFAFYWRCWQWRFSDFQIKHHSLCFSWELLLTQYLQHQNSKVPLKWVIYRKNIYYKFYLYCNRFYGQNFGSTPIKTGSIVAIIPV